MPPLTERAAPKVLCAGIAVQDIVMRVESFPAPGTKVRGSDFIITGGGCAANSAGACSGWADAPALPARSAAPTTR